MQFKYPEMLWALLALLIPIIIHLLRLRRFKKTAFTNVALLQKIVTESQKSQTLKKWLLLLTRLLLLAALIVAFAQPFKAQSEALRAQEMVVYVDNSFSMLAKNEGMTLLDRAIQDLIAVVPQDTKLSLFTNDQTFRNKTIKELQNPLLTLEAVPKQLQYDQILLKANTLFTDANNVVKDFLVLSDFQRVTNSSRDTTNKINVHLVQLKPSAQQNVFIDSLYLGNERGNQVSLNVIVKGLADKETVPISLFNGSQLIAKTAVAGTNKEIALSELSIPNGVPVKGKVIIDDPVLQYDNKFYFNIESNVKPKITLITAMEADFFRRIYTEDLFDFNSFSLENLDYSVLASQNAIILNGLESIPENLATILRELSSNGISLVVIPPLENIDMNNYNAFFSGHIGTKYERLGTFPQKVTTISFQHPLYRGVFERKVTNFDYPEVAAFMEITTTLPQILSYGDGTPFLSGNEQFYVFSASLAIENTNFINAPLVVPTFHNIGKNSLKAAQLYHSVGKREQIDVPYSLAQDGTLNVTGNTDSFIPLQQVFSDKVRLTFVENPRTDGIYAVRNTSDTLQHLGFNFSRNESLLAYANPEDLYPSSNHTSVPDLFEEIAQDRFITSYWKWLVILALIFVLLELLIHKLLP
ncbi:MAG: BatA domain-containing protein [Bacteroidota bacterium]